MNILIIIFSLLLLFSLLFVVYIETIKILTDKNTNLHNETEEIYLRNIVGKLEELVRDSIKSEVYTASNKYFSNYDQEEGNLKINPSSISKIVNIDFQQRKVINER